MAVTCTASSTRPSGEAAAASAAAAAADIKVQCICAVPSMKQWLSINVIRWQWGGRGGEMLQESAGRGKEGGVVGV